jgi:peptide chain release factor 2
MLAALRRTQLYAGEHDAADCYLSINAGAGGTDSHDWASMLLRMYGRFCERSDLKAKMLEVSPAEEAGIRSATLEVGGDYAYGRLRTENGVHRLVRISPFDSAHRRHTSFAAVSVIPVLEEEVVEINPDDLRIDTYRSSGAGGQHVNVTDSAVRITHIPTGIVVSCQNERSQHQNKESAMRVLQSRLADLLREQQAEKLEELHGEQNKIEWGSQIRSYVLQPYRMVKDHRTDVEAGDVDSVLDGDLDRFLDAALEAGIGTKRS